MTTVQYRHCIFVLNNPVGGDIERIMQWECRYVVFGEEVGEENKTPHLQGYVEWKSPKRLTTLKTLDPRIHWEQRRGSAMEASDYCKKGEQPKAEWKELKTNGPNYGKNAKVHEVGTMSQQGKRTDLDDVGQAIKDGASIREVAQDYPATFIKYHKGITALKSALYTHRADKPRVVWRYGPAGLGKTRHPVEKHLNSHYIKDGTQWWDGYEQQEAIIIDDFDGKWPFRDLLRLLDRYQYQGQYKGGYVPINSPYIYITCEYPPTTYWTGNELAQVQRRIDEIVELSANDVPV